MMDPETTDAALDPPAGAVRYRVEIDPTASSSHAHILSMVPAGARVLELGPATGATTKLLRDRACRVTTVEVDPEAAAHASAWSDRTVVADLDRYDLEQTIGEDAFDVVIAADVLEHLKEPVETLRQAARLLGPDGFCLVSLPNVAHGAVRLALLEGRWDYTDKFLLDRTHLRFFTRAGVHELFAAAGYAVEEIRTVERGLTDAHVDFDHSLLEGPIGAYVSASPDSRTWQFVARAKPKVRGSVQSMPPRTPADEQARLIRTLLGRARASDETINEQFKALRDQEGRIARLSREIETARGRLSAARRRVRNLEEHLRNLERSRAVRAARLGRRVLGLRRKGSATLPGSSMARRIVGALRAL